MSRSQQFQQGRRNGIKWAITYLHQLAGEMNDPHARAVLNCAAFWTGVEAKRPAKANQYNPEMVALLKRLEKEPPERTFDNAEDMLKWLDDLEQTGGETK